MIFKAAALSSRAAASSAAPGPTIKTAASFYLCTSAFICGDFNLKDDKALTHSDPVYIDGALYEG